MVPRSDSGVYGIRLTPMKTLLSVILLAFSVHAQTPLAKAALPTYIMAGASYNQFTGGAGFLAGIIPESSSAGLYASVTVDITGTQITDPVTKKTGYGLSPSVRAGEHKVLWNQGKNMLLIGGDVGASFASGVSGVTIGIAGSFTATYIRQINANFAVGLPVRMLWMSGVGPGGSGAWNPVLEFGVIWKP